MTPETTFKPLAFWEGTHPLSSLQESLEKKLVPPRGEASTPHGEVLRCMARLYYDVYNNGYCNAEVLQFALNCLNEHKALLLPYLEIKGSWKNSLHSILMLVSRQNEDEAAESLEPLHLEDITTAVVKYVAAQEEALASAQSAAPPQA